MNEQVNDYLDEYSEKIKELFDKLRQIIYNSNPSEIKEALWAKLPSYYVKDNFVRLIPFKDHINIEAQAIKEHKEELAQYKITPKGMLQISLKQSIPDEVLKQIFIETLGR